jgi:hypothetical protein
MEKKTDLVGRRQFIATSAMAVAVTALSPKLFAGEAASIARRVAVGYASFDDAAAVMAAAAVPAGDGGFIGRGARISISGVSGGSDDPKARRAVELLVNYSYLDGAVRREAPFRAWACSRATGCQGNPVSFTVPVDEVQRISFGVAVERVGGFAGKTERRSAVPDEPLPLALTLMSGADTLKLARGFYVLVPLFDEEREPPWSRYELKQLEGRWALHDRVGNPAPFEHFVLRIDYAKPIR